MSVAEMSGNYKDIPPSELIAVELKVELPGGVVKAGGQPPPHEFP